MHSVALPRSVLVVEDHALTLTLLCDALNNAGFSTTGVASAEEALTLFDSADPDLLLTDINLGGGVTGVELAHVLRSRAPYLAMVFLSDYDSDGSHPQGFPLPGGSAFMSKSQMHSADGLVAVIEAVLREESMPQAAGDTPTPLRHLTRRQLRLLQRIAQGWSNAEIARLEGLTLSAVEKLITRMLRALELSNDPRVNTRVLAAQLYWVHVGIPPSASN